MKVDKSKRKICLLEEICSIRTGKKMQIMPMIMDAIRFHLWSNPFKIYHIFF